MKTIVYNIGYFLKEAKTIFKVDKTSNIFSIFSIGLTLFILSLIFSGWWISNDIIEVIQGEAEINVYYDEDLEDMEVENLIQSIGGTRGVKSASLVDEIESYDRMVDVLGNEAEILNLFEDNPFTAFIEVKVDIEQIDYILNKVEDIIGVDHVRGNREIIDKLKSIINILTILGLLVITAVAISTIFVISHIIRQGIYNNRDQISTLKLLGAPESFIGIPFFLEGLFLTIGGGILSSLLIGLLLYFGYGKIGSSLLFVPLPSVSDLVPRIVIGLISVSALLGILGSLFGLKASKSN